MAQQARPLSARTLSARQHNRLTGIIDIGSNSIRLVVYRGDLRSPPVLFNEKVMVGLGRGVARAGAISQEGMALAISTLKRFAHLCADMRVRDLRTVATAAVRDASNGAQFVAEVQRQCGLKVDVLEGKEEARYSALGVISAIPGADGIVGDLGGGSLELIRIRNGRILARVSLPIGALRMDEMRKKGGRKLHDFIWGALDAIDWDDAGKGLAFYAVGGSWRALMQLHMWLTDHPLPMVHQYSIDTPEADYLVRALARMDAATIKSVPNISSSRAQSLAGAALLLRAVLEKLGCSHVVASAYGLREGVLFAGLTPAQRRMDPLIAAARDEGRHQGRFPEHGEALMRWMNGVFGDPRDDDARVRLAACLLADVAWRAHPDFRAERALDFALHGNWVGITTRERAMLGNALFACFGGSEDSPSIAGLATLADAEDLHMSRCWGLALRLGQRLTGGTARALAQSKLLRQRGKLILQLRRQHAALYGDTVARRLKALAQAMGLVPHFVAGSFKAPSSSAARSRRQS